MLTYAHCLVGSVSKIQFNIKKSSVMWFSTKSCQPQVFIDETPLSQVDKQKYLGVTFDSRLTCPHMWLLSVRAWPTTYT